MTGGRRLLPRGAYSQTAALPEPPTPIGTRVRVERETPSVGTFRQFDGKVGTIVVINDESLDDGPTAAVRRRVFHREYGVAFKAVTINPERPGGLDRQGADTTWFLPTELVVLELP